ncbi:MAG: DoxX family protein [Saprospiraceae bacterium]|nr:DoxX family protein [Pyrinomonadaceae bacterium]
MQRIYSTFPGAMPGVGLLVLRGFLGASVLLHSAFYLHSQTNLKVLAFLGGVAGVISGLLLMIGFLTPIISGAVCLAAIAFFVSGLVQLSVDLNGISLSALCSILVSIAVIFLGPGAFSIDARLFGRREIVIPPSNRRSNP